MLGGCGGLILGGGDHYECKTLNSSFHFLFCYPYITLLVPFITIYHSILFYITLFYPNITYPPQGVATTVPGLDSSTVARRRA